MCSCMTWDNDNAAEYVAQVQKKIDDGKPRKRKRVDDDLSGEKEKAADESKADDVLPDDHCTLCNKACGSDRVGLSKSDPCEPGTPGLHASCRTVNYRSMWEKHLVVLIHKNIINKTNQRKMILNQAHRSRDGLYKFVEAQKYAAKSTDEADVEGLESLAADMALEG